MQLSRRSLIALAAQIPALGVLVGHGDLLDAVEIPEQVEIGELIATRKRTVHGPAIVTSLLVQPNYSASNVAEVWSLWRDEKQYRIVQLLASYINRAHFSFVLAPVIVRTGESVSLKPERLEQPDAMTWIVYRHF